MPPPRMAPPQPPMPPQPAAPAEPDEPPAKRQKTEDQLVPEGEWLSKHPGGPINVQIQVPDMSDKAEYKLNGQTIDVHIQLTDTIAAIKQRIQEETQMPVSKQKLFYEGLFIKDSQTLAYYNMASRSVITLQMKERGGRKR